MQKPRRTTRRSRAGAWTLWCLLGVSCAPGESIRVRDRDSLLFSARANFLKPLKETPTYRASIGGELGGYGSRGDYTSPTGKKDYRSAVGYAAMLAEFGFEDLVIRPKLGLGLVDFAVEGQTTTVGEDGLGLLVGFEARYRLAQPIDAFVRGTSFQRSGLDSTMLEFGVGYYPISNLAVELGYGINNNVIDETSDFFNTSNAADVESQGLLVSMTVSF
jgi:hypothetical protein